MADAKRTLSQRLDTGITLPRLARMFERATRLHDKDLTKLKDEALRNKGECEHVVADLGRKYQVVADHVQKNIDSIRGLLDELRPLIDKAEDVEWQRPSTQHRVTSRAKRRA